MKIALINASPKYKQSASGTLLETMRGYIGSRAGVEVLELHKPELPENAPAVLGSADAWVFLFPLYVDGIPSHLLSCLAELEKTSGKTGGRLIYAVVNLGFYEGIQADVSLEIMKNWSDKCGFEWGGGIGVGGAGGLAYMPQTPPGKGPSAPIDKALEELSNTVISRSKSENKYVSIAFPRALYRMGAQAGWRRIIKTNGLKKRDLGRRPE